MGTKVSKDQGQTVTKKVQIATAFSLVAKQANAKRLVVQNQPKAQPRVFKKFDLCLPPAPDPQVFTAHHPCLEGFAACGFPTPAYINTNFNVNVGYGGGTALVLLSRRKSDTEGANLYLVRCGVDGNKFGVVSLARLGTHNIYDFDQVHTDQDGAILALPRFGTSQGMVLSNVASQGHCGCGVLFRIPRGKTVSAGISANGEKSGTSFLAICSHPSQKNSQSQVCLVQLRKGDAEPDCKLVSGQQDVWKFFSKEGHLHIGGPSGSIVALFCNHSKLFQGLHQSPEYGKVIHTEASDGTRPTLLLEDCFRYLGHSLLVLCSFSLGRTDTTSGLYHVTVTKNNVSCSFIRGLSSSSASPQAWTIVPERGNLVIYGPAGPNRFCILSNISEDVATAEGRCFQTGCVATSDQEPIYGGLAPVGDDLVDVRGWISRPNKLRIQMNERVVGDVDVEELLEQPDGRLGFKVELKEDDRKPGLKEIRAFAVLEDQDEGQVLVELEGSPQRKVTQPPGVLYAVNFGGPAYEALNGIVFEDTMSLFKLDAQRGIYWRTPYGHHVNPATNFHAKVSNTFDTFIYGTYSTNHPGFKETSDFDIPITNGNYKLKLYSLSQSLSHADININGKSYTEEITSQVEALKEMVPKFTAKVVTLPVTITDGHLHISFGTAPNSAGTRPSALSVHDDSYREPVPTEEETVLEQKEKAKLADKLVPLDRTFAQKEIKIAGWSSNLLENSTGQNGDMSHWDYSGNWIIRDGGDGVETKFVSSYMQCVKEQEIDLTKLFSEKHLDSAPEIQVSESFHQGCNNGGYYSLTATLMNYDGATIASKTTGMKGSITTKGWIRELLTFTGYGPGVRLVAIQSSGKDDKFWAGHFGSCASAACVRVKSEVVPASGDEFSDLGTDDSEDWVHKVEGLIRGINATYTDQVKELKESYIEHKPEKEVRVNFAPGEEPSRNVAVVKTKRKKREIRVFVSSTFRDFVEEREILIKKAFRELNRLCLDRGVFFTYVDLRWGITEKQTKSGQTISICLREIDKCRPYFICLLGDRFGWNQREKKVDKTLDKSYNFAIKNFKDFEWLEGFRYDTSVTKLEILHGALRTNDNVSPNRIFFYIRAPRVTREELPDPEEETSTKEEEGRTSHGGGTDSDKENDTPKDGGENNVDGDENDKADPGEEDGDKTGKNDDKKDEKPPQGESKWHFDQQCLLRDAVRKSGLSVREFEGAEDGCALIKEDLQRCVNEDFPPGTEMTALEREREAHLAFAEVRRRIYIGRKEYFERINGYFAGNPKQPLVLLGESGSGKSALVANWCSRYQEENPDVFMFMHFIGSSAESANYLNVLRRLYEEMKSFFQFSVEVPSSDRNLVLDLSSWLSMAGRISRCMIVLDALNQLDSGTGSEGDEQDLKWLLPDIPPNVFLLLSTLPGRAMDAVETAGWPTFKVEPLNVSEREGVIDGYMKLYSKTLSAEQKSLITEAAQSSNPLYLKALLDEVRMYGNFSQLTTAIKSYLAASNAGDLFVKILERFELDFEQGNPPRPHLVRDATTAIWCSHRGMSEQELLNFLQVPSNVWSPFYLSLEENLVNRNGIVNFFHDHLRQAVERKYLPTPADKKEAFLKLANFFNKQDIDDRYANEVPFLLAQAQELKRLRATILNVAVFERIMMCEDGKFQLIKCWRLLGGFEQVEESYLNVLQKSEQFDQARNKATLVRYMAGFFMQLGLLNGARLLYMRLLKELELAYTESHSAIVRHHARYECERRCTYPDVIDVLIELGIVSRKLGRLDLALKYLEDGMSRLTHVRTPLQKLQLVKALIETAFVFRLEGKSLDNAKCFLIRAHEVATEVLGPSHHYVAAIIAQIGELSYDQGRLEEALLLHLWDLQLTQSEVGLNHPRVAAILNDIALVHDDMNDKKAGELFAAVLLILREAYGKDHVDVASVRFNLGAFYFASNMYQKASYQFKEALRVFLMFLGPDHEKTTSTKVALKKLSGYTNV